MIIVSAHACPRLGPTGIRLICLSSLWCLGVAGALWAPTLNGQSNYVNFEAKQTNPLRLSPDGTRLFAVNTPDARLSVFDVSQPSNPRLIAEIPVGLEPVSVAPLNNDVAWVVNEVSDSVSIVSVSQRMVTDTLYVKDEPADVAFAAGRAFVTASRQNSIAVFDLATHNLVTNLAVFGENPRCLAVNSNGTRIYATFALSGNHTTIIPASNTSTQSPPTNPNLPPPPQVGLIVDATNSAWYPSFIKYSMPDNDVVEIDTATLAVTRYFSRVGTVNLGLALRPGSDDLYVANTEARNLVHFEPNVRSHSVDNRITLISQATGVVTPFDLNSNIDYAVLPNLAAKTNALAQPTAIVFEPGGSYLYVAAFGSDRIAQVDPGGTVLARIELCPTAPGSASDPRNKRGPRGLALNAATQRLYVLNRIANTLCIIDTTANAVLKEIPAGSYDPTPTAIRQGRGFLYDAKLSGNGTMACAACHIDAEMDHIAWDLGDPGGDMITNVTIIPLGPPGAFVTNTSAFHPMKGPMTTQTLRGLLGLDPLHWRGDRTNFLNFNIAFPRLLGGAALSDADMSAFRDFINTIVYQPNPNQNLDRTYPTSFAGGNAQAGLNAFLFTNYTTQLKCTSCHIAPPGPGSDRLIIPAAALQESQDFKVPQLRAEYQKMHFNNAPGTNSLDGFGIVHDGTDPSLQVFLSRPVFTNIRNDTTIKNNIAAFVQCFDTGTAPAVGYTRTLSSNNVATASATQDWSLLESQAAVTNIDLIVRGTLDGARHGLLYQPLSGTYLPDTTSLTSFTHAQLVARIQQGDSLTLMGVPPGSGRRLGVDRDEDGLLDGDVPAPRLGIWGTTDAAGVNWPYNAAGYNLENATNLDPSSWAGATDLVEIANGLNWVTNSPGPATKFYRLHLQ
jgi:YVTN family beta-propeller protein